jgi:arylsulfatase A-like enzyme
MRIKTNKILLWLLPGVIFFLFFWGCGKPGNLNREQDVLHRVKAHLAERSHVIDFTAEALPQRYLREGWKKPEKRFTQVNFPSSLLFFRYFNEFNDVRMTLTARAAGADGKNLTVLCNRKIIKTVDLKPGPFGTYDFKLPERILTQGDNWLRLDFMGPGNTRKTNPENEEERKPAAKLKTIQFHYKIKDGGDKGLLQSPNSSFSCLVKINKYFRLEADYQNLRGTESMIEVLDHRRKVIHTFELAPKQTSFRQTKKIPEPGLYKLRFKTTGREDSFAIWSRIDLFLPEDKNEPIPEEKQMRTDPADIILYVADTLRRDHVSRYGYERKTTPRFDRFAEDNTLYLNAYSNSAWTRPSAACIWTGLFPKNHKTQLRADKLPDKAVTLASIMRENGYHTAAFIANGNIGRFFGFDRGFDNFTELLETNDYSRHATAAHVNQAVFPFLDEYVKRPQRKPLFLIVWTVDPHAPYTPSKDVKSMFGIQKFDPIDTYDFDLMENIRSGKIQPTESQREYMRTRYDQEIFDNDREFGRLLDKLKELGLYERAAVIFTSDHGEEFFEHGYVGHGHSLYQEQICIPFAAKIPGIQSGAREEKIQLTDVFPTILEIAGLQPPTAVDGISLFQVRNESPRTLYFEERKPWLDLTALIGETRKVIYNRVNHHRPVSDTKPLIEFYSLLNIDEQESLPPAGFPDLLRIQRINTYRQTKGATNWQQRNVELPPRIDEMLKALGYIK